ncbi:MAG TPA: IS4 family transposase [Ktedonobacteraceae bacterium]|jgi:hypothetical protein|nr:IS4 family transposase [Ktedonobacteraceae bacterium]
MTRTIRQISAENKWCNQSSPSLFQNQLPDELIAEVLTEDQAWEQRVRKLNRSTVIWVSILLTLASRTSVTNFLTHYFEPLEQFDESDETTRWTEGALRYRLAQLPVKVFQRLFTRMHRVEGSEQTPGVFWRGHRLMAIDSTLEDVTTSPDNTRHFGRVTSGRSQSPFPQLRGTYLMECGTHQIYDATLSPCRESEVTMSYRLIRSIQAAMLVLLDRGFCASRLYHLITERGANVLALIKSHVLKSPEVWLPDGSYLATLSKGRNCRGRSVRVRVITYRIEREGDPKSVRTYRLATTLLDPVTAPAQELVELYHERWQIETGILELDRQVSILHAPLRGKTPISVLQEMYSALMAYNLVRGQMLAAATQPDLPMESPLDYSFTQSLAQVQAAVRSDMSVDPIQAPAVQARLRLRLRNTRLPCRSHPRMYPRVIKRLYSKFPPKRAKHAVLHQGAIHFSLLLSLST